MGRVGVMMVNMVMVVGMVEMMAMGRKVVMTKVEVTDSDGVL